jgi:PAS domain S-box-containing protein
MHPTLDRHLRRLGIDSGAPPSLTQWRALLAKLEHSYSDTERDRHTLEMSLKRSSDHILRLQSKYVEEHETLAAIIDSMGDGLCVLDVTGCVRSANPRAREILGCSERELLGLRFEQLFAAGSRELAKRFVAAVLSGQVDRCERAELAVEGGPVAVTAYSATPLVQGERPRGTVVVFRDVAQIEAAARELQSSEARSRAIFESAGVGIVLLSAEGVVSGANEALAGMLGRDRESLIGVKLTDVCLQQDRLRLETALLNGASAGAKVDKFEARFADSAGETVFCSLSVSRMSREGLDEPLIGVVHDETRTRRLEMELRLSQKLEAVGRLAAGIAHEINTPIQFTGDNLHFLRTAFKNMQAALEQYRALVTELDPAADERCVRLAKRAKLDYLEREVPRAIDQALEGVERVARIVQGMRNFAHPDAKERSFADLNQNLEATLNVARNEYKYVADVVTDFGELPAVHCFAGDLNQVFLNLIVNAAHAIRDVVGDTGDRGCIRVRTRAERGAVVVSFGDTGTGIPEEVHPRIFEPFFTTKEVGRGTGQGLAIARSIVERHGGRIWFETELGVGTTFFIELPLDGPTSKRTDVFVQRGEYVQANPICG